MILFGTYLHHAAYKDGKRSIPESWHLDTESLRETVAEAEAYQAEWHPQADGDSLIVMLDCRIMDVKTKADFIPPKQGELFQ